ncbi:hypothetical protein IEQ34_006287 [Dendrobium chrysotoxum]|uniref:Protein kinase domain-containing protein n=1 Tax=Dendrobium chrysotoxum TaxID=161865 RepID=A0AAV7H9C7_DENCH|nr:hypothetical protein IEQ34_005594 [Dendrobium chrysotoxum]KAH0466184.1 hypothetical protein IEQ34_006287 [Dendrobium chrysotoxum]
MRTKTVTLLAASTIAVLLILLAILWPTVGFKKVLFIIAGCASAVVLAILVYLLIQRSISPIRRHTSVQRRLSLSADTNLRLQFSFLRKVAGLPVSFPYKDLETATDNFRIPIGRGSSGSVYRGILDDGTVIAVKRIDRLAEQGDRDFRSEIAVIAGIQHVNLVRLLGYCLNSGGSHRLLVYEFARHGSLDKWIFNSSSDEQPQPQYLPWTLRVRVAVEVAKALAYLHHNCRSRVLHLDVKPENVLLDEGFHALVADFGLSKMIGRDESRVITSLRGTKGYLAPEWLMETGVTDKSDVYSFGMVLLEIVGGRRNCLLVEQEGSDPMGRRRRIWSYFPAMVVEKVREKRVMEVVDGRMGIGKEVEEEVKRLINVALWCIQEEGKMRPSMERVVDMLEGRMGVVEAPPQTSMMMAEFLDVDMIEGPASALQQLRTPEALTYSFSTTILSGR